MPRPAALTIAAHLWLAGVACSAAQDGAGGEAVAGSGGSGTSAGTAPGGAGTSAGTAPRGSGASGGTAPGGAGAGADNGGSAGSLVPSGGAGGAGSEVVSLLVFSRTAQYRHESIPAGIDALTKLAAERGWELTATEDPSEFSDVGLARYRAVIFLSTTGDVLDDTQQGAFERFIRAGNGFVGIHSATDTEYDWSWYGALVGAYFREHPAIQPASVVVEPPTALATAGLPNPWPRTDEWYAFKSNPRDRVQVLLSLDEDSYAPGASSMSGDHPVAWQHEYDGGRAFYTALGHTSESYVDPAFLGHLAGGISWALTR